MIGTALAIGSALVSMMSEVKSAQANAAQEEQLQNRQNELDAIYNKEYYTPYMDTDEAQSAITVLRNNLKEQQKKVAQSNAINGASDEARVATNTGLQRNFSDAITRIAGHGTAYKDAIRREYMGYKMGLDNLEAQNLANKSGTWLNLANNAMSAGQGFAEADANGAFDKWDTSFRNLWHKRNPSGGGVSIGNNMPAAASLSTLDATKLLN